MNIQLLQSKLRALYMLAAVVFLLALTLSKQQSAYYDIPAYYGHFSLNFFEPEALAQAQFAIFEYHFAADATYAEDVLFVARESEHCIYSYNNASGEVVQFAGNCGISGNIIGSVQNAEFNGVSSLAYFRPPSPNLLAELQSQELFIVANGSCSLNDSDCILSPPYTNLTMENLRFWPQVDLYAQEQGQEEFLYVADTGNHCIKRISITAMEVEVVAGRCGQFGFLDGPMGYNRLNAPRNLGITRSGTLFFFDSGNEYVRILTPDGNVKTLLLGACKERGEDRTILGYKLRKVLCYQNWVEYKTDSSVDHYFDPSILNSCPQQASKCQTV